MQYRADSLGLVGQVTTIFRELVHERLGLFYEPAQFDQVADRLAPLVVERGLGSFMDYYYLLKYTNDPAEWGRVMDALAVPETYFWRESDQMRAVVGMVVPALIEELRGRPLRIWSVPCAGGEEPLTLAMMLEEARGSTGRQTRTSEATPAGPPAAGPNQGGNGPPRFRNRPPAFAGKNFTRAGAPWIAD